MTYLHGELTANLACYLITAMRKSFADFQWGVSSFNENVLKQISVVLPINSSGKVDNSFMEHFIYLLKKNQLDNLNNYLRTKGYEDCILTIDEVEAIKRMDERNVDMKEIKIVDLFNVSNSHNILKSDVVFGSGTTPYVTASANNNSITSYISYDETMKEPGNSIMIGGKTLVVTYQPNDFFSNDSHNLVLRLFNDNGRNEDSQLFLVSSLIKSLSPKYSWGDSISKQKIQKDLISLPFKDGEIDFSFMSTYIRAIKKQCIAQLKVEIDAKD